MKRIMAAGSWLRRRLEGRWQWVALIGILAFFNTAQLFIPWDYIAPECYAFHISPDVVLMDVHEESREMRVWDWGGTLNIYHDCNPNICAVTSNNTDGVINISTGGLSLTGKCTIVATDTLTNGKVRVATASVEVRVIPMHIYYLEEPFGRRRDFGTTRSLALDESMTITVAGGVKPYKVNKAAATNLNVETLSDKVSFTVMALEPGLGMIRIIDSGLPEPDVAMLCFEVR